MVGLYTFNFFINVACLPIAFFGLIQVVVNHWMDSRSRKVYGTSFFFQLLFLAVCLAAQFAFLKQHPSAQKWLSFFECVLGYVLLLCSTLYLLYYAELHPLRYWPFWVNVALGVVYLALQIASLHTTIFYYFEPDGSYHNGSLYFLLSAPILLKLLIDLYIAIRYRNKMKKITFALFTAVICLMIAATVIQVITGYEVLVVYVLIVGSVIMFADCFDWQNVESKRREEELSHQRANNLILQMRPHFIYNVMMSIYYLCEQDTQKAQQVILDFSSYLQKNFTALSKEGTIPFAEELEHVRAYLAVEQVRFEDKLTVQFDTPCTAFRLPALTLQPIVENAVKHGIDPEHDSTRIYIRTEETKNSYKIHVENDGAAYDPKSSSPFSTALANTRTRLDMICGGKLSISARKNLTVVTVTLPKKKQKTS